jgi:hypothetical protein
MPGRIAAYFGASEPRRCAPAVHSTPDGEFISAERLPIGCSGSHINVRHPEKVLPEIKGFLTSLDHARHGVSLCEMEM